MKLLIATGNAHKIHEFRAILGAGGVAAEVLSPAAVGGMPHVIEDAGTFEGNAAKKALALRERVRGEGFDSQPWLAVADDSGLCVDALDGAPGVHSARFADGGGGDAANTAKLLGLLAGVPEERRTAAFRCCIAAVGADGEVRLFEGRCAGRIIAAPRGAGGFGYDPVFVPDGHDGTFAELPAEVKNRISHRARALAEFVGWLRSR